ncbi:hypothetical protein E8E11_007621 [Didymella keratinophila]|nr:hypothetical protein E8E11_007621 [Didymella keratinophila]
MDIRRSYHPEADRLATVAMLFLEKYSGTYRTRDALRAQVEIYLDKEYPHDLKWLNREKDLEYLVDFVKNAGGIVIVELPLLLGRDPWAAKTAEAKMNQGAKTVDAKADQSEEETAEEGEKEAK